MARETPNINQSINKNAEKSLEFRLLKQQDILANSLKEFQKISSKVEDKKLSFLLKEFESAKGKDQQKLLKTINEALKEQNPKNKKDKKLLDDVAKSLSKSTKESIKQQKLENRKSGVSVEGIQTAFKQKDLGGFFKDAISSSLNFSGITKGLLHGAGVAFDLPALNILASEIGTDSDEREKEADRQFRLMQALTDETDDSNSNTIKQEEETFRVTEDINEGIDNSNEHLANIDKNIEEFLFIQKDINSDLKSTEDSNNDSSLFSIPKKDEDGVLDAAGNIADIASGAGLLGIAFKALLIPLGLLTAAVGTATFAYNIFSDALDEKKQKELFGLTSDQTLTSAEKQAATIAIANGGTLEEQKSLAQKQLNLRRAVSQTGPTAFVRSFGTDEGTNEAVEKLGQAGILALDTPGISQVRDWDAVRALDEKSLFQLLDFDDWDEKTKKKLTDIWNSKRSKLSVLKSSNVEQAKLTKSLATNSEDNFTVQTPNRAGNSQGFTKSEFAQMINTIQKNQVAPVVVNNSPAPQKPLDQFPSDDLSDVTIALQLKGLQ